MASENSEGGDAALRRMRIAIAVLIPALVTVILTLTLTLHNLSVARGQLADMEKWQAGMIAQLSEARRAGGRNAPVAPDDAGETLAEIIASRDSALLVSQRSSPVDAAKSEAAASPHADIAALSSRASTGVAGEDAAAIERDSQTPWKDWK